MRLIEDYSLLAFMTPRQYYYPRVVLQFYHSMTSRGADGPRELQFSIDDRRGVLRAADISEALGPRIPLANAEGYRDWAHPPHREMVRSLARDTTAMPVFYRRQLPPQMLLIYHYSGPVYSRYSIMCSGGEPSWRLFTGSRRDFGSVPLSW